jgi:hypothetical protein
MQEACLEIRDPVGQERKAPIVLRPVDLERLDALVNGDDTATVRRERTSYARWLVLGIGPAETQTHLV